MSTESVSLPIFEIFLLYSRRRMKAKTEGGNYILKRKLRNAIINKEIIPGGKQKANKRRQRKGKNG